MTLRVVIMGVSGCGKTAVGAALAARLGVAFQDGDDLHPPGNVAKMRDGVPLEDTDRWPWLDRVAGVLRDRPPVVVGCSALRRAYRDRLRAGAGGAVRFVHLTAERGLLEQRMKTRTGHFMPPALLDSQLATLEPPGPDEALVLDAGLPLAALVDGIAAHLEGAFP